MSNFSIKGFLAAFLGLILSAFLAMAAVSVVVDPYWRFDLVNVEGFNAQRLLANSRIAKPGVLCRLNPTQVILGTSRAEVGLDPTHPAFSDIPGPVYNAALAGSGLHEIGTTFRHAVHASPNLQRVLVGLDFLMFNAHRELAAYGTEVVDYDEERLLRSPWDSCWRNLFHDYHDLLGLGGVRNSVRSIRDQIDEVNITDSDIGAWIAQEDRYGFRRNFEALRQTRIRKGGYRAFFGTSQERYYTAKIWRAGSESRYCFAKEGQPNTIDEFRRIVRFARSTGLDVRFFVNPIHVRMLVAIREAGLWPQYEEWKRALVAVLAEEANESGKPAFALWDFSGFNSITAEVVPPAGDTMTRQHSFWEPSHYQSATGALVLDRILDHRTNSRPVPNGFGISLTAQNIDDWITNTRMSLERYRQSQPEDVQLVTATVDEVMAGAEGSNCGWDVQAARAGAAALARGDRATAERSFQRAVRLHRASQEKYEALGVPFRETGFADVLALARKGVGGEPRLATWQEYQSRGIARSKQGDFTEAARDFELAIRIGPTNTALHFLRGTALLQAGDNKSAAQEFEKGLKLEPQNKTLASLLQQARGIQK
jgi:tetratricopeptide (TPR) repeat protein